MRKLILIFCGVFCCLTALHAKDPALYLYQVDALDKVFKDRRYFVDEIDTLAGSISRRPRICCELRRIISPTQF